MSSIRGLDPFPRGYEEHVPRSHIPYLEDIRRASNAVRVLRRRGKSTGSAEYRAQVAAKAYRDFLERERADYECPGLF